MGDYKGGVGCHMWAKWLHNPCRFGVPDWGGNQNGYKIPTVLGAHGWVKWLHDSCCPGVPEVGGNQNGYMTPGVLQVLKVGTKYITPAVMGATVGQNGDVSPTILRVLTTRTNQNGYLTIAILGAPMWAWLPNPAVSGVPKAGRKSKWLPSWEPHVGKIHNPCRLGGPQSTDETTFDSLQLIVCCCNREKFFCRCKHN